MTVEEKFDLLLVEISGIKTGITGMSTEIAGMKTDMATKVDVKLVFDELMNVETWLSKHDDYMREIDSKTNTLILKADNTALLLKMIERLESRVDELEKNFL